MNNSPLDPTRSSNAIRRLLLLSLATLGLALSNAATVLADASSPTPPETLTAIERHCDEFALLRLHPQEEDAERLVLPTAQALFADGRLQKNLRDEIKSLARQKEQTQRDPNKQWSPEPYRVLHRKIEVHGDVATAIEFLGAIAPAPEGEKIKPRRRTVTWIRHGDDVQSWKVAALHESNYSNWESSISSYERQDAEEADAAKVGTNSADSVVFVGSSSIRGWKTLKEDFAGIHVIGRGFGGSQLIDSTMYAHRIVLPYRPKAVVVYAGDNDIAFGKSPEHVAGDFRQLASTLHASDPNLRIGFIAIKPSLKRWEMWPTMKLANQLVVDFAKQDERIEFLDIATPMFGRDGTPKPELFVKDGLHLSREGYELWTSVVKAWLAE